MQVSPEHLRALLNQAVEVAFKLERSDIVQSLYKVLTHIAQPAGQPAAATIVLPGSNRPAPPARRHSAAPAPVAPTADPPGYEPPEEPQQQPAPRRRAVRPNTAQPPAGRRGQITKTDTEAVHQRVTADVLARMIASQNGGTATPAGNGKFKVNCPSPQHRDSNPSCSVTNLTGRAHYFCFGCKTKGDVYEWVELVGLASNFPEAHAYLTRYLGLDGAGGPSETPAAPPAPVQPEDAEQSDRDWNATQEEQRVPAANTSGLVAKYAAHKLGGIDVGVLTARDVHEAHRRIRTARGSYVDVRVVRHPVRSASGDLLGWQDLLRRDDADRHCGGMTKRSAYGMHQAPLIGAETLTGASVVWLCEGLSDWLVASAALTATGEAGHVAVGVLGTSNYEETAALLAEHVPFGATLVAVPDQDGPGLEGFTTLQTAWAAARNNADVLRVALPDGVSDLRDHFVSNRKAGVGVTTFGVALLYAQAAASGEKNRTAVLDVSAVPNVEGTVAAASDT